MRKRALVLFILFNIMGFVGLFSIEPQLCESVRVGIVTDSDSSALERTREALSKEITDLLEGEFEVSFSEKNQFAGDWTVEGVRRAVDDALADDEIDLIVGIGVISSNDISHRKSLNKPSFAPFVMNVELQQLPIVDDVSGVDNLNYLTFPTNLKRDLAVFHQIVPFKKLAVLVNGYVLDSIPVLQELLDKIAQQSGIQIETVPLWTSSDEGMVGLSSDVDAIYVLSLAHLPDEEIKKIARLLIERKIPSFTLFSQRYLGFGFFASMSPDSDLPRLIRRLALNIQRVLLGENPKDLPVQVSEYSQLTMNMKTARAIDVFPPWELLQNAVQLNEEDESPGLTLTLEGAVRHGLEENLDLAAIRKAVDVGREEVNKANSYFYPQVNISGTYTRIDRDRAKGFFGIYPENGIWGRATLSQMLYSSEVSGNARVEKYLHSARKHEYCSYKLDAVLAISQAYLNLLRAQTVERIHRNNLEKTRSHLKLARQRTFVGAALASEVYRWESKYSNDLTIVMEKHYQTMSEGTSLKRILDLPQQERLVVQDVTLQNPLWQRKGEWIKEHVRNDGQLELFIGFSVQDSLCKSEDVKNLQQKICAQAEVLGVTKRAFWSPDISLDALVSDRTKEWGAGSDVKALYNSTDWGVAVNVSFPLYTGGYKSARKRQACEELKRLRLELQALVEVEKEQIRNAVYHSTSTYTAIELSRKSADSAHKNFDLVQDSYSKGTVSIVDLLDAQNLALVSDLVTANAVYDFIVDLMVFQHSIGRYDFFAAEEEVQGWIDRIEQYFRRKDESFSLGSTSVADTSDIMW